MKSIAHILISAAVLFAAPAVADDLIAPVSAGSLNYTYWDVHKYPTDADQRVIQAAMPELIKRYPDWHEYKTEVTETNASFIVEFWRPSKEGSIAFVDASNASTPDELAVIDVRHGGLVVELGKESLRPIRVSMEK